MRLTDDQKKKIQEVCRNLINAGISYAHQRTLTEPVYSEQRGVADIEKILRGEE